VSGTIGQPDASSTMTGGSYALTGGFWSIISVIQSVGVPNLVIVPLGGNQVQIRWPAIGTFTLQQNNNIAASAAWADSGYTVSTANGTNSVTITAPQGNLFFRLANP